MSLAINRLSNSLIYICYSALIRGARISDIYCLDHKKNYIVIINIQLIAKGRDYVITNTVITSRH